MAAQSLKDNLAGRFLVIDGPDGAGKSTQVKLLAEHLRGQGVPVCAVRDPGGTVIGDRIRQVLLDVGHEAMTPATETLLFMASRAQLAAEVIRPALARGECVLGDRYVSSTVAYQGAAGMKARQVQALARVAVGEAMPDLTILLDLPADEGLRRVRQKNPLSPAGLDRMEAKELRFHRRVRSLFLRQARRSPERFAVVDALGGVEEVQERLRQVIEGWTWNPAT